MKRFLFFILIVVCSCNQTNRKWPEYDKDTANWKEPERRHMIDTSHAFLKTQTTAADPGNFRDSGYFKGPAREKINYTKNRRDRMLDDFISKNLSKKDIRFLNKETLSHSVFFNKKSKTRFDTLSDDKTKIISVYKYTDRKSQTIIVNGSVVKIYKKEIYDFHESSFRRFLFKGKEFYYLEAGIMDCEGDGCLADIYFLYDVSNRSLHDFFTFRVSASEYLFGDIDGDDRLDFLEIENNGFGGPMPDKNSFKMHIYLCSKTGKFEMLKDKKGVEYYIDGNSGEDWYLDNMYIEKSYWPVKLINSEL